MDLYRSLAMLILVGTTAWSPTNLYAADAEPQAGDLLKEKSKSLNLPHAAEPVRPGTLDKMPQAVAPGTLDAPPKPIAPGTLDRNIINPDEIRDKNKPIPR